MVCLKLPKDKEHGMKKNAKEQLVLFGEASSQWQKTAVQVEKKPAVVESLASLFVHILSQQRKQKNKEASHAR
jgi:hypothetical protein